jgi:hypothetical protein
MIRETRNECCGLIAAYREGLGLAAVVVTGGGAENLRIKVAAFGEEGHGATADGAHARWWCRRAADAERVAAAAARLLRRESKKLPIGMPAPAVASQQPDEYAAISRAETAVLAAAHRLNVVLQSDQEIAEEAAQVIARLEAEMQQQQRCGGLKAVNKAYRDYRLATSARGERVLRYDEWMSQYRQNLVRQVAAALRQL